MMIPGDQHPATIDGIKSWAWRMKRADGCTYGFALNEVSRQIGYANYQEARHALLAEAVHDWTFAGDQA